MFTKSRAVLKVAAFVAVSLLPACASPDIGPFAEQTAGLKAAVVAEQAAVKARYATVVDLADRTVRTRGEAECPPAAEELDREAKRRLSTYCRIVYGSARYSAAATDIEGALTVTVAYASKLQEVAEAGETGSAAFGEVMGAARGAIETVGATVPGGLVVGGVVEKIGEKVAQIFTRVQAQRTLESAMSASDEWIALMESAVADLYAPGRGQEKLATGIVTTELGLLQEEIGNARITLYKGLVVAPAQMPDGTPVEPSATRMSYYLNHLSDRLGGLDPRQGICASTAASDVDCLSGEEVRSLAAAHSLMAMLEPGYLKYVEKRSAARAWEATRAEAGERITIAVRTWRAEHARLARYLEACGGLNAAMRDCGKFDLAKLSAMTDALKSLLNPKN